MKNYTVSQLAKLSGVTVRSLHFYDELGLLKPAFTAENGYRYYQEKQLLVLQQILFFRELGFELKQIQEIISKRDFDQLSSLQSHKKVLKEKIEHLKTLMTTVDKTINHIQGKNKMSEKELFFGLQNYSPGLREQIRNLMETSPAFQKVTDQMFEAQKDWTEQDKAKIKQETDAFWKELAATFNKKLSVDNPKVQKLIRTYDQFLKRCGSTHDQTQFMAMAEYMPKITENHKKAVALYPELKEQYEQHRLNILDDNPGLAEFMCTAMKVYAEHNLVKSKKPTQERAPIPNTLLEQEKKKQEKDTALWLELAKAFNKGRKAVSAEVQLIMEQYRQLVKLQRGFDCKPEMFNQMADYTLTMLEHHKKAAIDQPELASILEAGDKAFYDNPGLIEFLAEAMRIYAKNNQS